MTSSHPEHARRRFTAALLIAGALAAFAGLILWDSARLADLGGYSGVGPATIPRVIAVALIGLSVWTVINGFLDRTPEPATQSAPPVLWVIVGLAIQLLLLKVAGFSIATGVMFAMTARAFGKRNFAFTIPLGIMVAFCVWVVFSQLLSLHLPAGPLENLFFSRG